MSRIKAHYMHVWNCHNETSLVQLTHTKKIQCLKILKWKISTTNWSQATVKQHTAWKQASLVSARKDTSGPAVPLPGNSDKQSSYLSPKIALSPLILKGPSLLFRWKADLWSPYSLAKEQTSLHWSITWFCDGLLNSEQEKNMVWIKNW
jgi:hypothetical protein